MLPTYTGLDLQKESLELDSSRVFGPTVDPGTLLSVRTARLRSMRAPSSTDYTGPGPVMLELDRARKLCRQRGWRKIDVSARAVEENASKIIDAHAKAFGAANREEATRSIALETLRETTTWTRLALARR